MSVSKEDVSELLNYIENIKSYDTNTFKKLHSINAISWGFLYIYSGTTDFLFNLAGRPLYSIITWFMTTLFGMILSILIFSNSNKTIISDEIKKETQSMRQVFVVTMIATISLWIVLTVFQIEFVNELILPFVAFVLGVYLLTLSHNLGISLRLQNIFNPQNLTLFVGIISITVSILMFTIYQINPSNISFFGILFGGIVGTAFLTSGTSIWMRK